MNWERIEGNWKNFAGEIKSQWGRLSDDDVLEIAGRREALEGKLQQLYGLAQDEARWQVDKFKDSFDPALRAH